MTDTQTICYSPWIKSRNIIWEQVLHLGQRLRYSKNAVVGGNGEYVGSLQYLYKGRIKLCRLTAGGIEKILFYIEKGNLFGEVPFWSGSLMDGTFIAMEECEVYAFSRQCVKDEIVRHYPALIVNLLEGMANKSQILSRQACDIANLTNRVSRILVFAAEREHVIGKAAKAVAVKGISQQELASILGVHRVTINHAIGQLKRQGIVGEMTKSRLVILDYERLLELASQ